MHANILTTRAQKTYFTAEYCQKIPEKLEAAGVSVSCITEQTDWLSRLKGHLYSITQGSLRRNVVQANAERIFLKSVNRSIPLDYNLILNTEDHLRFFKNYKKSPHNIIGTLHCPHSLWDSPMLSRLQRMSSAITLYQEDIPFFEHYVGKGRVHFVHHGVDTKYFTPKEGHPESPSILCIGTFLHDWSTVYDTLLILSEKREDLSIDIIIDTKEIQEKDLEKLSSISRVRWHYGATEYKRRQLLQESTLLLHPLKASGVSHIIPEALACGCPIVTHDSGGIRDYGGESLFPLCSTTRSADFTDLTEAYLNTPGMRETASKKCRCFAEEHLTWEQSIKEHLEAYHKLIS